MPALARLQTSDCANPALDIFTSVNGVLANIFSAEYQIFDKTSGTPVQVYPVTLGNRATVDVNQLCPAGQKISTGRYVALWTVPSAAPVGTYEIKWYIKLTSSVAEQVYIEEFEVLPEINLAGASPEENYVMLSEMRDEGVTTAMADDTHLAKRIALASRFVERTTKQAFYPRTKTLKVDGRGGPKLLLSEPIIAIEYVKVDVSPFQLSASIYDPAMYRVYNRHLSQGLLEPDDRSNPKIELYYPVESYYHTRSSADRLVFPVGQQNVEVKGVFGYTDPDGSNLQGRVPDLIKHVTKLIVMRELVKMGKVAARSDVINRIRLTSERTRDQAYTLEALGTRRGAFFTGDPEIDNILAYYLRPPGLGAA